MQITDLHIRRIFQALTGILAVAMIGILINFFDQEKPFASTLGSAPVEGQKSTSTEEGFKRPPTPKEQAKKQGRPVFSQTLPDTTQDLIETAEVFFEKGLFKKSLELYQSAAELSPKNAFIYERIGDILFIQKQFPLAEKSYEVADLLSPEDSSSKMKLVKSLLAQRKVVDANRLLENSKPETAESVLYQGIIAAFLNQPEKSKTVLNRVVNEFTDTSAQAQAKTVLAAYQEFELNTNGKIVHLQALLAKAFNELEEYELAIALGLEAIKIQDDYRDIWIILGHSYLRQGRFVDAKAALTKALKLDEQKALAHALLGFADEGLGIRQAAIKDFESALARGYTPALLLEEKLAENYYFLGEKEKALRLYEKVIFSSTEPVDAHFYVRPIFIYIDYLHDGASALRLAQKAFTAHPDDAMSSNLVGWAFYGNGDETSAEKYLLQALKKDPKLPAAHFNLARLYENQQKIDQAKTFYQYAFEFAEEVGDTSIGPLAAQKYNELLAKETE